MTDAAARMNEANRSARDEREVEVEELREALDEANAVNRKLREALDAIYETPGPPAKVQAIARAAGDFGKTARVTGCGRCGYDKPPVESRSADGIYLGETCQRCGWHPRFAPVVLQETSIDLSDERLRRTPDQKRRDADGVDYGSLDKACPSGHNHFCPECGKQHMHDGENHPDCDLRGIEHSWNRWEPHALDDRVMLRFCDRCGASERSRLETTS